MKAAVPVPGSSVRVQRRRRRGEPRGRDPGQRAAQGPERRPRVRARARRAARRCARRCGRCACGAVVGDEVLVVRRPRGRRAGGGIGLVQAARGGAGRRRGQVAAAPSCGTAPRASAAEPARQRENTACARSPTSSSSTRSSRSSSTSSSCWSAGARCRRCRCSSTRSIESSSVDHHDGLHRRQRRDRARLPHHADRARRVGDQRRRLHRVDQPRRRQHRHRAPQAQPQQHRRAGRGHRAPAAGALRAAGRGRAAGRSRCSAPTGRTRTFYLSFTSSERSVPADHRLAAAQRCSRSSRRSPGVQRVTHRRRPAASPCASGSIRTGSPRSISRRATCRRRCSATTTSPPSARPRATWSRSTCSPTPTCARSRSSRT